MRLSAQPAMPITRQVDGVKSPQGAHPPPPTPRSLCTTTTTTVSMVTMDEDFADINIIEILS